MGISPQKHGETHDALPADERHLGHLGVLQGYEDRYRPPVGK
jgi:hypothetical protein